MTGNDLIVTIVCRDVVVVLAFYSDYPNSNPAEALMFFCKFLLKLFLSLS